MDRNTTRVWALPFGALVCCLALLAVLLLARLLASRIEKLTEKVWTVELVAGCALDYHTSERALALACPGVDYIRLWPLPVVQPWEELENPRPVDRQMARVRLGQER